MVAQKETKEKEKSSRENLGKFFYDLAKATFTIMVLTNLRALVTTDNYLFAIAILVIGIVSTIALARTLNSATKCIVCC